MVHGCDAKKTLHAKKPIALAIGKKIGSHQACKNLPRTQYSQSNTKCQKQKSQPPQQLAHALTRAMALVLALFPEA